MKLPVLREFAIATAGRAGDLLLTMLDRGLDADTIREKTGFFDIVTEADIASEKLILAALREAYPDVHVLAEESGSKMIPDVEWLWVVDPIDGTTNFSHALPVWGVNIGLLHEGRPVIGVTHDASNGRTYWAERGGGAWVRSPRGERRLHVSTVSNMERALLATGFQYHRLDPKAARHSEFAVLDNMTQSVRRLGAASMACAWVAAGHLEAYWETGLKPWDFVPGWVMIEEAGGRLTEHDGSPARLDSTTLLLSNGQPAIHGTIMDTIAAIAGGLLPGPGTSPGPAASSG